jgi:hypothetical protein
MPFWRILRRYIVFSICGGLFVKRAGSISGAVLAVLALAGCSSMGSSSGDYDFDCPEGGLAQVTLLNLSNGSRSEIIIAERLDAIQNDVERAFDCEAQFTLAAWSSSSASTVVLFSGQLLTSGASEIGRDRKIKDATDEVMTEIRTKLEESLAIIDGSKSDMTAAFAIAADRFQVTPAGTQKRLTILADGISTTGTAENNSPTLTEDDMIRLAQTLNPVDLAGAEVAILGVGRIAGAEQPPEDYVAKLRAYLTEMCGLTGATCRVASSSSNL